MRVALVVERFDPAAGGVERVAWNVAQGLAEAGDEVQVFARRGVGATTVQLHRVPVPAFWQPLRVSLFARQVDRAIRECRFDVVHSFSRTLRQDVFHAGGSHAHYMQHTYGVPGVHLRRLSPRHAVLLEIERRIFEHPTQIIQCVSRFVADGIASRFEVPETRLAVIYYGIEARRFEPERNRALRTEDRARLGADGATVWAFAGSGWHRKGLDTALRALASSADVDSQLWVAGKDRAGPWQRLANHLGVGHRVRFLGARGDVERVYAAVDGLLLPTRYDACALSCLEAAASGLPVVTSAANGASEVVGDAGIVVHRAEDVAGFARALERLADPALRERLGAIGRRIAEAQSWAKHVEQLRALYARVAG